MREYMEIALNEAKKAKKHGDVPVGAVIIKNGIVISKAHNEKEKRRSATRHAEIIAIEKACKKLKTWHLDECELYVTLEPCLMCCGAIIQSRIKNIYYSTESKKFGYVNSVGKIFKNKNNHIPNVYTGLLQEESVKILKGFFKDKRD
jgi:tRNA(adenine34) deaminase